MKRREFVKCISAAAITASIPFGAFATNNNHYDVIIVGAGLAGLSCARDCEKAGLRYLVLEASERVGGRIKSLTSVSGLPELGGMQIGYGYGYVRHLIDDYQLSLKPPTQFVRGSTLSINGQLMTGKDWASHSANKLSNNEKPLTPTRLLYHYLRQDSEFNYLDWHSSRFQHLDVPLIDYLQELGASKSAINYIDHGLNALDVKTYSALDALKVVHSRSGGKPGFEMIEGGNEKLPITMAKQLKNQVALNHVVKKISQSSKNKVKINCLNGAEFSANSLVLATPFSTLRKITLAIPLSQNKEFAINNLGYTPISQFVLSKQYDYWNADQQSANLWADNMAERNFAMKGNDRQINTILGWVNGSNAQLLDQNSSAKAKRIYLEALASARKSTKEKVKVIHHQSWMNSPYQLGAYAHYKAGTVGKIAPTVALNEGNVHFAGEHTIPLMPGMEAAVVSGVNAAYKVVNG